MLKLYFNLLTRPDLLEDLIFLLKNDFAEEEILGYFLYFDELKLD